jgi:hypothetical protein
LRQDDESKEKIKETVVKIARFPESVATSVDDHERRGRDAAHLEERCRVSG